MSKWNPLSRAELRLFEMEVFGSFTPREQRFIALVLGIIDQRIDARTVARTGAEADELERMLEGWSELFSRLDLSERGEGDAFSRNLGVFGAASLLARRALDDGWIVSYRAWSFLLSRAVGPAASSFAISGLRCALINADVEPARRAAIEREMDDWVESGRAAVAPGFEFTPEWLPERGSGA